MMTENTTATIVAKVNKSKLILAAFKTQGLETPANDIVDDIKQTTGVDVTVSLINNIRHKVRAKRAKRAERVANRTSKAKRTRPVAPVQAPVTNDLDCLLAVKKFAAGVGGLESLKGLITTLERFQAELFAA